MKKEDQFYSTFNNLQILALQKIKIANIHTSFFGHVMQAQERMFVQIAH
jgi:hypothetical protein